MENEYIYIGEFESYEEYYAVGTSYAEVKTLLWKMYCRNCYNKPTKEERREFDDTVYIRELPINGAGFGFNSAVRIDSIFTLEKNGKLKRG